MGDFFAFRRLITLPLIRVVYVLGIIAITWFCIDQAVVLEWIGAQIVWRLACEGVVVFFSIHERLRGIEDRLGGGNAS